MDGETVEMVLGGFRGGWEEERSRSGWGALGWSRLLKLKKTLMLSRYISLILEGGLTYFMQPYTCRGRAHVVKFDPVIIEKLMM